MFNFLREPVGYLLQKLVWASVVLRKHFPVLSENIDPFNTQDFCRVLMPDDVVAISKDWNTRLNRHTLYYPPSQRLLFKKHQALARHYATQNAFREEQIEEFSRESEALLEARHYIARVQAQSKSLKLLTSSKTR